jgi:hypothetical protein
MCNPVAVVLVATAVSGAVQYQQQKASSEYQSKVAERNADIQENQAADARARGVLAAEERRDQVRQMEAQQAVGLAGNGLDISSGTSLDLFAETATLGEYDIQTVQANAAREAFGYDTQAANSLMDAKAARTMGKNARTGTLLTTAASVGSQGYGAYASSAPTSAGTYGGGSVGNLYG